MLVLTLVVLMGFGPKPSVTTFSETFTAESQASGVAGTWEDWNIAATVGTGVRLVLIGMQNTTAGAAVGGVRQNGSSSDRLLDFSANQTITCWVLTDANGVIERRTDGALTRIDYRVLGFQN